MLALLLSTEAAVSPQHADLGAGVHFDFANYHPMADIQRVFFLFWAVSLVAKKSEKRAQNF
jgi:hypothetical protein